MCGGFLGRENKQKCSVEVEKGKIIDVGNRGNTRDCKEDGTRMSKSQVLHGRLGSEQHLSCIDNWGNEKL